MKHCYTECKVVSNDEYRIRYDCCICKKSFYELKDRIATRNGIAGSVLFIDGSPFITCGNEACNQLERQHDSKKIRIFYKWEELDQVYDYTIVNGRRTRYVRKRFRPVLRTVNGCIKCYAHQESQTALYGKPFCFNMQMTPKSEPQLVEDTTKYKPIEPVEVVPYTFPTLGRTKVQAWGQTKESYEQDDKDRTALERRAAQLENKDLMYGPYRDRKGK